MRNYNNEELNTTTTNNNNNNNNMVLLLSHLLASPSRLTAPDRKLKSRVNLTFELPTLHNSDFLLCTRICGRQLIIIKLTEQNISIEYNVFISPI